VIFRLLDVKEWSDFQTPFVILSSFGIFNAQFGLATDVGEILNSGDILNFV